MCSSTRLAPGLLLAVEEAGEMQVAGEVSLLSSCMCKKSEAYEPKECVPCTIWIWDVVCQACWVVGKVVASSRDG